MVMQYFLGNIPCEQKCCFAHYGRGGRGLGAGTLEAEAAFS